MVKTSEDNKKVKQKPKLTVNNSNNKSAFKQCATTTATIKVQQRILNEESMQKT